MPQTKYSELKINCNDWKLIFYELWVMQNISNILCTGQRFRYALSLAECIFPFTNYNRWKTIASFDENFMCNWHTSKYQYKWTILNCLKTSRSRKLSVLNYYFRYFRRIVKLRWDSYFFFQCNWSFSTYQSKPKPIGRGIKITGFRMFRMPQKII